MKSVLIVCVGHQIYGTDPIFVIWWSTKGVCKPNVDQIPIICQYVDVFPKYLLWLPPTHVLEFTIELVPKIYHISKALYRMEPTKLAELKNNYRNYLRKNLLDLMYCHECIILFLKKSMTIYNYVLIIECLTTLHSRINIHCQE